MVRISGSKASRGGKKEDADKYDSTNPNFLKK